MIHMAVVYFLFVIHHQFLDHRPDPSGMPWSRKSSPRRFIWKPRHLQQLFTDDLKWLTCTKWNLKDLNVQSMIPFHSKTQNDGWNWFLNVFDMFYFVFTCYDLFRALSKYFNSIFANASRIETFQWWKHAKRWVFEACSIVSHLWTLVVHGRKEL